MLRLCIRGAGDVPCNAACSVPPPLPHPGAVQVGARPGVLPAARLHHGRRTASLVGRGKLQIPQAQQHAQKAPVGRHRRLRLLRARLVALGDWLGVLLCGDERLYRAIHTHSLATTSTCSPHSPILTYLLTGTTTRWASIIGRSTRSITSLPTRCPLTRVSSTSTI